jgi:hypothetical protein
MSAKGHAQLFALATWPYILSVSLGQWGPLLMAATTIPAMGWVALIKPNLGVAFGAGYGLRWARPPALWVNLFMAGALLVTSFAVRPRWVGEWLTVLATPTPHLVAPIGIAGGVALLLALFRWRRPEARTLATLSLVPQTFSSYDSLLVFIVPQTRAQALVLVAATTLVTAIVGFIGPAATYAETVHRFAPLRIALVYMPAVVMVLMRPNLSQRSRA